MTARILLGPGPTMADPRVLRAMATPLLGQFDPEFTAIMNEVMALTRFAFQTENAAGSRWLPIHAVQAVRNGLDPDAALRSMTSSTAKMYKLDDRIGTLARGKDGDLVVLSGDPFDLTTQVRAVVVNGRIALDKRK